MPLKPVKDIKAYAELMNTLKNKFRAERTGEQTLLEDRTKLFKPLINVQQETAKAIQDKIAVNQDAIVPFTKELQRRNDQRAMLAEQPFYRQEILPPEGITQINLDAGLNETDNENLLDMSLELPSAVFEKKLVEETLDKIKVENRSIGQMLGKGASGKKLDVRERGIYESRRKTIEKYKEKIKGLEGAAQFVGKGLKKRGRPFKQQPDVIYYNNPTELLQKLHLQVAEKQAGNTGLDNNINSVLDELLYINVISKDEYNVLFDKYFQ